MEGLYDGSIQCLDDVLQNLVEGLKNLGEFQDTLIVLTSDHGEGFGERTELRPELRTAGHMYGIDEILTHAPLLVKAPNQTAAYKRTDLASLTRLPEVVEATLDDSLNPGEFGKDVVVSGGHNLQDQNQYQRAQQSVNVESYDGTPTAVYTQDGGKIVKYAKWGPIRRFIKSRLSDQRTPQTYGKNGEKKSFPGCRTRRSRAMQTRTTKRR